MFLKLAGREAVLLLVYLTHLKSIQVHQNDTFFFFFNSQDVKCEYCYKTAVNLQSSYTVIFVSCKERVIVKYFEKPWCMIKSKL